MQVQLLSFLISLANAFAANPTFLVFASHCRGYVHLEVDMRLHFEGVLGRGCRGAI